MGSKYLLVNYSIDPYYNLALEEYLLLKYVEGTIVMLWQNENSIIIGRHQNAIEEINQQYVQEHNIQVVRRTTGGGAVYHDFGNLNYSLIMDRNEGKEDMSRLSAPIVDVLRELGVPATFSGRNDIIANGKKISGTAQRVHRGRLLQHGCLLFDADLSVIAKSLRVREEKFQSKSIKSVRSRVGNIKEYLKKECTIELFREKLIQTLAGAQGYKVICLSDLEQEEVVRLADGKYRQWEWTYGHPLKCSIHNYKKYEGGTVEVYLNVEHGVITECVMYGDFMALKQASDVAQMMIGCKYQYENVWSVLNTIAIKDYFGTIEAEEVAVCICCAEER